MSCGKINTVNKMKLKSRLYFIYVLLAGALWGTAGIFVRTLQGYNIGEMEMIFARALFSCLALGLIILFKDKTLFKVRLKDIWLFALGGICSIVLFNFAYYNTMALTSLSVAAVLLYTAPFFVMLISVFLFGSRFNFKKLSALLVAFLGCCLVSGVFDTKQTLTPRALFFGLLTGFGYGLYTIFSELLIKRGYKTLTITFYVFLFALGGTVSFIDFKGLSDISLEAAVWAFAMALFNTVLPYIFYTTGLYGVDPTVAPIIATIEPVVATVVGVVFFKESLTLRGALGILLVLLSVGVLNLKDKSLKLKACAKINLCLGITGKREDGYHLLDTVMQSVSLFDTVVLKKAKGISLACSERHLSGEDNLGIKAARLFFEYTKTEGGAEIYIKKKIPEAGGMGGGSADAAAVLVGLNTLYETHLSLKELSDLAVNLGADVPFFLKGGTVKCEGIGEILTPLKSINKGYFVIAKQGEKPSTGEMYRRVDNEKGIKITSEKAVEFITQDDMENLAKCFENSFLSVWGENKTMELLNSFSPLGAGLSGSGPTCFAYFKSRKQAKKCHKEISKMGIEVYFVRPSKKAIF